MMTHKEIEDKAKIIADMVVPRYRLVKPSLTCNGHIAKQWSAAYNAAGLAFTAVNK